MATPDYETVLRGARRLPPEELRRLRHELDTIGASGEVNNTLDLDRAEVVSLAQARAMYQAEQSTPLSEEERTAALAALDRIDQVAAEIGAAWNGNMSAAEAVREQRREL